MTHLHARDPNFTSEADLTTVRKTPQGNSSVFV
jgi:hypothetical protein